MGFRRSSQLSLLAVAASLLALFACSGKLEKPPVEVLERESLLGAGKIIQIRSTTNEELSEIEVTIKAEDREMRHTELRLGGYQTVEIGWKKLGGWQIPETAEIEVRVAGYLLPVRSRLAAGSESEEND